MPPAAITKILEAARWAPSSNNSQPWSFVVVRDRKTISKLMQTCHYGAFYYDPTVLVAVVLEPVSESQKGLLKGKAKELTAYHQYLNIGFPVSNMVLEARSLGIDSFIASPVIRQANSILGAPKDRKVILLVGLGYEEKGVFKPTRERKSPGEIVFFERYRKK